MILSAQSIRWRCKHIKLVDPFSERGVSPGGLSFGLSACGYDVRLDQEVTIAPGEFKLASTYERFRLPLDLAMAIRDKSTWARRGIFLQTTQAEPGWEGYLTLEITNQSKDVCYIANQEPIAQVAFELLDCPTDQPYTGKYQSQPRGAQPPLLERPLPKGLDGSTIPLSVWNAAVVACKKDCTALGCMTHRHCRAGEAYPDNFCDGFWYSYLKPLLDQGGAYVG